MRQKGRAPAEPRGNPNCSRPGEGLLSDIPLAERQGLPSQFSACLLRMDRYGLCKSLELGDFVDREVGAIWLVVAWMDPAV